MTISQLREKIDACLITHPEQSSRTIRAEEGILMSLAQLMPHFRAVGKSDERKKRK
jgi:predicted SPOUT superfamily RNA methylase MTH1